MVAANTPSALSLPPSAARLHLSDLCLCGRVKRQKSLAVRAGVELLAANGDVGVQIAEERGFSRYQLPQIHFLFPLCSSDMSQTDPSPSSEALITGSPGVRSASREDARKKGVLQASDPKGELTGRSFHPVGPFFSFFTFLMHFISWKELIKCDQHAAAPLETE